MSTKSLVGIVLGIVFLIGAGYIVYMGRPVMKLNAPEQASVSNSAPIVATPTPTAPTTTAPSPTVTATAPKNTPPTSTKPTPTPVATTPTPSTPTTPSPTPTPAPEPTPSPSPTPGTYTLAEVQTHASPADCWAVIGSNVYDLTSWVSRHPGGATPIQNLCGTDASARFERKHGGSTAAKAALGLLKIGTLR